MTSRQRPVPPTVNVPERTDFLTLSDDLDADWPGADVLAVTVAAGRPPVPDGSAATAARRYGVDLASVIAAEKVTGRAGEVVRVPVQAPAGMPGRLLLVGTGTNDPQDLRRAGAGLARACRGRTRVVTTLAATASAPGVRAAVEGLRLGGYAPPSAGRRSRRDAAAAAEITLVGAYPQAAVTAGVVHAAATTLARDLALIPASTKTPAWLAAQAAQRAERAGLAVTVWDEAQLAAEGFGGLVAVGGGSVSPPRLVRIDYTPQTSVTSASRRVVLVGKGVTFDTGGLSIKPREAMVPMKTDMAAAGAVLAAVLACPERGIRRPVTALLPLAENAVGEGSYRPGDVLRHYGGRTVEVINTDAEGRLVLADALAYADAVLDPDLLVDVATLTGAATLGLGRRHAALFTADERLARGLSSAASASGERVWRMPLVEDYRPALDSAVADLRHSGTDPRLGGGAITAALFLREFVGSRRWAHLDIAGTGRADKDEHEVSRGATGYGARLLLRWLESLS